MCCTWVMTPFESHTILTRIYRVGLCTISINMPPFKLHMSTIYRSNDLGEGNSRGKTNILFHSMHTTCVGNGMLVHPAWHGIQNLGHHTGTTALGDACMSSGSGMIQTQASAKLREFGPTEFLTPFNPTLGLPQIFFFPVFMFPLPLAVHRSLCRITELHLVMSRGPACRAKPLGLFLLWWMVLFGLKCNSGSVSIPVIRKRKAIFLNLQVFPMNDVKRVNCNSRKISCYQFFIAILGLAQF